MNPLGCPEFTSLSALADMFFYYWTGFAGTAHILISCMVPWLTDWFMMLNENIAFAPHYLANLAGQRLLLFSIWEH